MIVGMPAAGPEAHLLDGEAVTVKPLSRALGFLLQEPILCKDLYFALVPSSAMPAQGQQYVSQDCWTLSKRNLKWGK